MFDKKFVEITNPNEITKGEFDKLNEIHNFDIFSKQEYAMALANLQSLIKKGEKDELSDDEKLAINEGVTELKALKKYVINELVEGQIVKSEVFVQPKQVHWHDVIEKSETGEKIERGTFLDTELNRSLGRVGVTFEKGKKAVKEEEDKKEIEEEKFDDEMFKAALEMVKKGGMDKKGILKAMKDKYEDGDEAMMKKCMNKAYKSMSEDYMKKAEEEVELEAETEEEDEEKSKKKKSDS